MATKTKHKKVNHLDLDMCIKFFEKLKNVITVVDRGENKKSIIKYSDQTNSEYGKHLANRIKILSGS